MDHGEVVDAEKSVDFLLGIDERKSGRAEVRRTGTLLLVSVAGIAA